MPTLSSSIVRHAVATMKEVEDALARQVLYGGDLLTNLLELAPVDEARLLQVLSQRHGLEPAPAGELPQPAPAVLRLVPRDIALRHEAYPLPMDDPEARALGLCVAAPLPSDVEEDLAFLLGVELRQYVSVRQRVLQALARDYGAPLDRRSERVLARLEGSPERPSEGPPAFDLSAGLAEVPRPPSIPPIAFPPPTELPSILPEAPQLDAPFVSNAHEAETTHVPEVALRELAAFHEAALDDGPPTAYQPWRPSAPPGAPPEPLEGHEEQPHHGEDPSELRQRSEPSPADARPRAQDTSATLPSLRLPPLAHDTPHPNVSVRQLPQAPAAKSEPEASHPTPLTPDLGEAPTQQFEQQTEPPPSLSSEPLRHQGHEQKTQEHLALGADEPPAPTSDAPDAAASKRLGDPAALRAGLGRWRKAERPARRRGPYTAAAAEADLLAAPGRDQVLATWFDFAAQFFDYAALFALQGDLAEGWSASGAGASAAKVRGIGVPLDLPSALADAKQSAGPLLQSLARAGLDESLAHDLRRPSEGRKLLLPIEVRGHCILILLGCDGAEDVSLTGVGPVLAFAPRVSQAFEQLILRRKQQNLPPGEQAQPALPNALTQLSQAHQRARRELAPAAPAHTRSQALIEALAVGAAPPAQSVKPPDKPTPPAQPVNPPDKPAPTAPPTQSVKPPDKPASTAPPAPPARSVSPPAQPVKLPDKPASAAPPARVEATTSVAPAALPAEPTHAPPGTLTPLHTIPISAVGGASSPAPAKAASPNAAAAPLTPLPLQPLATAAKSPTQVASSTPQRTRGAELPGAELPNAELPDAELASAEPIPLSKPKHSQPTPNPTQGAGRRTAVLGSPPEAQRPAASPASPARVPPPKPPQKIDTPPQGTPTSVSQLARARRAILAPSSLRRGDPALSGAPTEHQGSPAAAAAKAPGARGSEPPVFPLTRRSSKPPESTDAGSSAAQTSTPEIDVSEGDEVDEELARALLAEEGPEIDISAVEERSSGSDEDWFEDAPLSMSSRRVAVGPQRPQASHDSAELQLPKVIVNEADANQLVQQLIQGDAAAEDELVKLGASALGALLAAFPGPLTSGAQSGEAETTASQAGPLLRALTRVGRPAVPFIAVRTQDRDPVVRAWATRLLGELPCGESARAVGRRLLDRDLEVRRAFLITARQLLKHPEAADALREVLKQYLVSAEQNLDAALAAAQALTDLRDAMSVPLFFDLLQSQPADLISAAHEALVVITRQDFQHDLRAWRVWWQRHLEQHRIEWLIEALTHEAPELRRAAGDELKSLTKEYFGYYDDLPEPERQKAQARYREWWSSRGRQRFA